MPDSMASGTLDRMIGWKPSGNFWILTGLALALVGCLLWLGFGKSWLGHLPGDIHFRRGGTEFYFPIVTCVLLSVVLSILRR